MIMNLAAGRTLLTNEPLVLAGRDRQRVADGPLCRGRRACTLPELPAADEPGPFSLADPRRIRAVLAGAGFGGIGIEPVEGDRWMGGGVDDVIGYYTGMPFARQLIAASDEHTKEAVLSAMRQALRPCQRAEGVVLRSAAWLVTAAR
jgi:hypothetical protein